MTATFQEAKFGERVLLTPRVPQGLAAAVEGLTREVIRHRPENIYTFAAHHFEKLLRLREQYDDKHGENKKASKLLREMNEAIKERHEYSREANDFVPRSGWSLNETAKVLEKHRSIFGESGQKMSTEEVRELANETITMPPKLHDCPRNKTEKRMAGKYASRKETPRTAAVAAQDSPGKKSDSRGAPRIISQIPLAKDIKTELKRNRISSKERKKIEEKRMQVACDYSKETTTTTTIEKTSRRSVERTKRTYESRSEQRKSSRTEKKAEAKPEDKPRDKPKDNKRSTSMDRVKHYAVQNIAGMTSLDELQSPSYVEKVQEVIDETSTIIKEKVEALKTGVVKAARTKQTKKDRSSSSEERSKTSSKSSGSGRKSQEEKKSESGETKASAEQAETKNSDNSEGSNESKISLPAVRPPSSKSTSRSLSARSDSDGLVLPPISPESAKSPKVKEDLVLPVLSPPRSTADTPDVSADAANSGGKTPPKNEANKEEEFQDSLNVTPDLKDAPQRPDSLETSDTEGLADAGSPLETLKDKLLEIEEVQKRIKSVLDDTITAEEKSSRVKEEADEAGGSSQIQDKLLEIQESERRIEKILDLQTAATGEAENNVDIKVKLQELQDAEKRIENILIGEAEKESTTQVGTNGSNAEQEDSAKVTSNNLIQSEIKDAAANGKTGDTTSKSNGSSSTAVNRNNGKKHIAVPSENARLLSPHSYILTEGSPCEIPDSVTTVIIPDRSPSPDSDTLQVELEDGQIYSTLISAHESNVNQAEIEATESTLEESKTTINNAFGEVVDTRSVETSTVDAQYIHDIKVNHDKMLTRQDLDLIQEERDKETDEAAVVDSEDEKVLRVVTTSLEEILEKDEVEYVTTEQVHSIVKKDLKEETEELSPEAPPATEYDSTDNETKETSVTDGFAEKSENVENSLDIEEITGRSAESTNEFKETTVTDRSSLTFDPAVPLVPELNLDSLPDLTISSFNITDDEQKDEKDQKGSKDSTDILISSDSSKESGSKTSPKDAPIAEDLKEIELESMPTFDSSRNDAENIEEIVVEETKESSSEVLIEEIKESLSKAVIEESKQSSSEIVQEESKRTSTESVKEESKKSSAESAKEDSKKSSAESAKEDSKKTSSRSEKADSKQTSTRSEKEGSKQTSTRSEKEDSKKTSTRSEKEDSKKTSTRSEKEGSKQTSVRSEKEDSKKTSARSEKEGSKQTSARSEKEDSKKTSTRSEKEGSKQTSARSEKEDSKKTSTRSEKESSKQTSARSEKEDSKKTSTRSEKESSKQASARSEKEDSKKTSTRSEKESSKQTSARSEKEDSKKTSMRSEKEEIKLSPTENVKEKSQQFPTESVSDETKQSPTENIKEQPKQSPTENIKEELKQSPTENIKEEFKQSPTESIKEQAKESPAESIEETPKQSPVESIKEEVKQSPTESIKEESKKSPTGSIKEESKKSPTGSEKDEPTDISTTEEFENLEKTLQSSASEAAKAASPAAVAAAAAAAAAKNTGDNDTLDSAAAVNPNKSAIPAAGINNSVCAEENKQTPAWEGDDLDSSSPRHQQPLAANETESRASSQCTTLRRLDDDSDDLSIKINEINPRPDDATDDKKECHVYVPEASKDLSSSTESSTFMSAATKIQAGVRGFLTRRRLHSTQRRSSTLDSVPSIQESFAAESSIPDKPPVSTSHLLPIVESLSSICDSKTRHKLRREDAVQRTTLSVENAFADNQLQHTGEFHDCIPLPVFDAESLALRIKQQEASSSPEAADSFKSPATGVEQLLGKILHGPGNLGPFVDVVLLPGDVVDPMLQSKYLNFITSVEDVFADPLMTPGTPKGVIIEEITSMDENKSNAPTPSDRTTTGDATDSKSVGEELPKAESQPSVSAEPEKEKAEQAEAEDRTSLVEASITTSEEPLSMNIDEVLGLGDEDRKEAVRFTADLVRSSSASQESQRSDARTEAPVAISAGVEEKDKKDKVVDGKTESDVNN